MTEAGTLCTNGDVVLLAGANADATGIIEASTNVTILMSEGVVCALGRFDFVTNYGDLTDIAKEFLRTATATLTAIAVITYDMSGYTTRIEGEDMLNLLWAKWRDMKASLIDQNFVRWAKA